MALDWIAAQVSSLYERGEPLLQSLSGVSLVPLALAIAFHVGKLGARARAWHNIVRAAYPSDRPRFRDTLAAFLTGVAVDAVVPAHPGLLLRLGLLRARLASSTLPGLLSTRVAEWAFDVLLTALVLGIAITLGFGSGVPSHGFLLGAVAEHPLIAALAVAAVGLAITWLGRRLGSRARTVFLDARRGFAVFAKPVEYGRTVASWQALGWAMRLASVYWFLVAFHLPATLAATIVVLAVQLVASAIPVTPGGAGPQQAMLVMALSAGAATVLGFGIGMQAATVLADLALGAASLVYLTGSLSWRRSLPASAGHAQETRPASPPASAAS